MPCCNAKITSLKIGVRKESKKGRNVAKTKGSQFSQSQQWEREGNVEKRGEKGKSGWAHFLPTLLGGGMGQALSRRGNWVC